MKYVLLHGDGVADWPQPELEGKTPLQAAARPNMDMLAQRGEMGIATVQVDGLIPNSDVVELALLGYDPRKFYPGPAPLEAAGLGIVMGEHDVVFRCNMVTFRAQGSAGKAKQADIKKLTPSVIMDDDTAGGLETEEARELIDALNEQIGSETIQFYPVSGHRHLMVWVGGKVRAACVDPHEVVGRPIGEYLPTGDGADILRKLMEASLVILKDHPINDQRRDAGLKPVHCLWLWGQGRAPHFPSLTERRGITGAILTTSDVHRGIAVSAGLSGETSPTSGVGSFLELGEAALHELEKKDFVYVHAQAEAELDAETDPKAKIKMVEAFDQKIVGPILDRLSKLGSHRVCLVCGRPPLSGTPAGAVASVPYVFYRGPAQKATVPGRGFCEADAEASAHRDATKLINLLLQDGSGS